MPLRNVIFGVGGMLAVMATVLYAFFLRDWIVFTIAVGCAASGLAFGYTLGDEHARRG